MITDSAFLSAEILRDCDKSADWFVAHAVTAAW
jgi:hypothetical protein